MQKWFLLALIFVSCSQKKEPVVEKHDQHSNELHLSDQQIILGNIQTQKLTEREIGEEIELTGTLSPDQNKINSISSRVMGRIEKLNFKNNGEKIKKGDVLYSIYSEDLNLAAREYKLALENKKSFSNEIQNLDFIVNAAKNKLHLFGLTNKQISRIESEELIPAVFEILSPITGVISEIKVKEGNYVMEGESIYQITDYSSLWAEIQVYINDLTNFNTNEIVTVTFPGIPTLTSTGKIEFVNPEVNNSSQINMVRISVPNPEGQLTSGMQVHISLLLNKQKSLALPTDAIIIDGKGSTVWVKTGHNTFKNVMVKTGIETSEYTQIISGLKKGDEVVISGAYLLSGEYSFNKGANPMEGHDMSKM